MVALVVQITLVLLLIESTAQKHRMFTLFVIDQCIRFRRFNSVSIVFILTLLKVDHFNSKQNVFMHVYDWDRVFFGDNETIIEMILKAFLMVSHNIQNLHINRQGHN